MTFVRPNPNGTMSKDDFMIPEVRAAADAVQFTQKFLHEQDLAYSHWCGQLDDRHLPNTILNKGPGYEPLPWAYDDANIPWFTLWEYSWILANSGLLASTRKLRVLSLGGSSSSCEATVARWGHHVTTIESRPYTAKNAAENATRFGWDMTVHHGRIEQLRSLLEGSPPFDMMISSNVLFLCGEEAHQEVRSGLQEVIVPGGWACFSFDFLNPNPKRFVDDPVGHFDYQGFQIKPGQAGFIDNGERHHFFYPDPAKGYYTAGAIFLQRASS